MVRRFGIFFCGLSLFLLHSCQSTEVAPTPDYFPTPLGKYLVYSVEEIQYSAASEPVESTYQLKVVVDNETIDATGKPVQILYRYTRENDLDDWTYLDTWSVRKDLLRIVVNEGTTSFVKLAHPISLNRKWNGNLYNSLGEDEYEIVQKGSYTASGNTFNDCVIVLQEDNQDFIVFQDKREEVYAADVGLIYREIINLHFCTIGCAPLVVDSGFEFRQTLLTHGEE